MTDQFTTSGITLNRLWRQALVKYGADAPGDTLPSASDIPSDPEKVLDIVEARLKSFKAFKDRKTKIREILGPILHVVKSLSDTVSSALSMDPGLTYSSAAGPVFQLFSALVQAAKDSRANYDIILRLLEDCRRYLDHVNIQISSNVTEQQKRLIVETLVELLRILAMARNEIVRGKPTRFLMNLVGKGGDVADVRDRWNRLLMWDEMTMGATTLVNTVNIKAQMEEVLRRMDELSIYDKQTEELQTLLDQLKAVLQDVKAERSSEIIDLADKFVLLAKGVKTESASEMTEVVSLLKELTLTIQRLAEDIVSMKCTVQALPAPVIMKPSERKQCPLPTPTFTGREGVMVQMQNCFFDGTNKQHLFVLHGLGGAGKSQIAYEFVERCNERDGENERFSEVFFIDASSREMITANFKNIALNNGCDQTNTEVLAWFRRHRTRWLILFDNADDPALNMHEYLPRCTHGDIIITTRNPEVVAHARGRRPFCKVSGMLPEESSRLLVLMSTRGTEDESSIPTDEAQAAKLLVKDLGFLALAVVQAGAYISTMHSTIVEYADLYRQRRSELLEEYRTLVQKTDDYGATVYTTWRFSFEQLPAEAKRLLEICAFMHHEGISETFFSRASQKTFKPVLPMTDDEGAAFNSARTFLATFQNRTGVWDKLAFSQVIRRVMSYSLLDFDKVNKVYSIHPLVHEWLRATLCDPRATRLCVQAMLSLAISDDHHSTVALTHDRLLLPHIDNAVGGQYHALGSEVASLIRKVYDYAGRWMETEQLDGAVLKTRKQALGEEHPDTLLIMSGLASTYWNQGRWAEAEELFVPVMETRKRVLGEEHPSTLTSMSNLASTYWTQGRKTEAEELEVTVMEISKRVLGEEHPDTLTSISNLASTYSDQGRWTEAEELEVMVMEARKRVLGEEHPDTLKSMSNLASTYSDQGRWAEAERLQAMELDICKRVLGGEHPDTLTSMSNLALTYYKHSRWTEAEGLQETVTETWKHVLDEEHPYTLKSMSYLALTYYKQGRLKEAERIQVMVMEKSKQVLGEEHVDTLTSISNLASTYSNQRRWIEAEGLQVVVVEISKRVLGEEHPETLKNTSNLAFTYSNQGKWMDAERLQSMVMNTRKRVLGDEHPSTLTSMSNIASTYCHQGRWTEAEELQMVVMEISKRVLGEEYPHTLTRMSNLAVTYVKEGRWTEAEGLQVTVMETRKRVLGEEHPSTLTSMSNLVSTYSNQGHLTEAERLQAELLEIKTRKLQNDKK